MNSLVEFSMGVSLGYLLVSITESIVHRSILHAKKSEIRFWEKLGCFGRYIQNSWYSHHVVHHFKTFKKNHVTMFESEQEEMELSRYLIKNDKEQIVLNSYGLRIGGWCERLEYLYAQLA